jgi:hypothetical protein
MASAQALNLLGVIAFPAHDIIQNGRGLVSQADIFFLAFYPLFAIGVLFLPMAKLAMRERIKVLLDICIVVITAAMLVWAFLIGPVFQAGMGNAGNATWTGWMGVSLASTRRKWKFLGGLNVSLQKPRN